jgi:hypothetical protein
MAHVTLTEGIHIPGDPPSAEMLLTRWGEVADRRGETVPLQGWAQSQHELKKTGLNMPATVQD